MQLVQTSEQDIAEVKVCAIVLAAGHASRMGQQKVLLPLGGRPLVQWVVDAALGSKADSTIVVVGHEAGQVSELLGGQPVSVVLNPDYAQGMSTSLGAGVRATSGGCDGVLVLLGDQPFVTPVLLNQLIDRFAETKSNIVRAVVGDRPANPVLMGSALFPEILRERGDLGGRRIVERHPTEVCLVPADPREVADIDAPDDYEAARRTI